MSNGSNVVNLNNSNGAMSASKSIVVATHGHCFDGLCSAVLFTRLMRHLHPGQELRFEYHSSGYGPGQNGVDPKLLVGNENAILDFRFSAHPALTWYFDHHVSAFPNEGDRETYEAHVARVKGLPPTARRMFHDGGYTSCTKLIADVGASVFGLDPEPTRTLVSWADMIDSANFPSAEMAVSRHEPVLQLMTVVENKGNDAFLEMMVPRLLEQPLEEVARAPDVATAYEPLRAAHESFIELVRAHAQPMDSVVLVDLTDQVIDVAGKFVTYALYPESQYSVLVTRGKTKCKLSIGYNPWSPVARDHNIASICERHGGGGHPVVGAISLTADQVDRARSLAREIVAELQTPESQLA
ncbi:hypothetical protein LVJ94_14805 [Pendulispora rubella]|uniref:Phosphoesterase n=1 Tax=Pendulispora rubella TaxID=2741070 RepID=A0ABZ2LF41_9BACT